MSGRGGEEGDSKGDSRRLQYTKSGYANPQSPAAGPSSLVAAYGIAAARFSPPVSPFSNLPLPFPPLPPGAPPLSCPRRISFVRVRESF
jgi:hypothetical protein